MIRIFPYLQFFEPQKILPHHSLFFLVLFKFCNHDVFKNIKIRHTDYYTLRKVFKSFFYNPKEDIFLAPNVIILNTLYVQHYKTTQNICLSEK